MEKDKKSNVKTKVKTNRKEKRRNLTLLIVCFFNLCCFGQSQDTTVYINPDVQPMFKYEEFADTYKSCEKYFEANFKMPPVLLDNGYMGRLILEFIIEKNGAITYVKVLRGMDESLDKVVLKAVKNMPKWTPAINKKKIARSKFILSVDIDWLYGKPEEMDSNSKTETK